MKAWVRKSFIAFFSFVLVVYPESRRVVKIESPDEIHTSVLSPAQSGLTYLVDRITDASATGGEGSGLTGDLRYAITRAQSGDKITFNVAGTIQLSSALPTITRNINVEGTNGLTVQGAGGNVFSVGSGSQVFISNVTITGGSGNGGAIFNNGVLTLNNVTIYGNKAGDPTNGGGTGAGIWNYVNGTLTLNRSTVRGNSVFGNSSYNPSRGGGIANYGILTLNNSTVSGNSASEGAGGGISNTLATSILTLNNSTVSNNAATGAVGIGSGIDNHGAIYSSNTIIARNVNDDLRGTLVSRGHNLIGNSTGGSGFRTDLGDMLNINPMLGGLQNNGGSTWTHALLSGSPAIDSGDNATCLSTDQRGVSRPRGLRCDIGAFEYAEGIDVISPSVQSIRRASANPTSASNVAFTVTFSEAVTGVSALNFAVASTGGVSGAGVTQITGSGTTYTVTVHVVCGNGSLRLDVSVATNITDSNGNSLDGLPFTNGEMYTLINKDCADTTGVFRPSNGLLYLKNSQSTGFADVAINYGIPGDYPVVGDWDGDGTVTIGVYRNGSFYLRNSNSIGFANAVFSFGQPGDQPIAGDWDGNGLDTIGVYRSSIGQFFLRNSNNAGNADISFYLGNVGDVGIAGDWNGDGKDTTGVFRPINGIIFLKNTNDTGFADVALNYGIPGDKPVIGDWDNDGIDTIGVYRNGRFFLRNSNDIGFADIIFDLGNPADHPIAGNWDGLP